MNIYYNLKASKNFVQCLLTLIKKYNIKTNNNFKDIKTTYNTLKKYHVINNDNKLFFVNIEKALPIKYMGRFETSLYYLKILYNIKTLVLIYVKKNDYSQETYVTLDSIEKNKVYVLDSKNERHLLDEYKCNKYIDYFIYIKPEDPLKNHNAEKIVHTALSYVGLTDMPLHSNNIIFNDEFLGYKTTEIPEHWCVTYIWYVFHKVGLSKIFCNGKKINDTMPLYKWAKKEKLIIDKKEGRYGDIILWKWEENSKTLDHISIIVDKAKNNNYITIDGNTSFFKDDYGGHVFLKCRKNKCIYTILRPKY